MSNDKMREQFEAWWPSVGQTIGKVAAWKAWQAAIAAQPAARPSRRCPKHEQQEVPKLTAEMMPFIRY